jgi:uncharacterized cupredoxin-like copper-binding protein
MLIKSKVGKGSKMRKILGLVILMSIAALILAACGAQAAPGTSGGASSVNPSGAQPVTVTVTVTEFKFETSMTTFKVGVPYHFVLTNTGKYPHEFDISNAGASLTNLLAKVSKDSLGPGATATLDYTFTQPAPAGTLAFTCHLPGHYEQGMNVPIVVEQ